MASNEIRPALSPAQLDLVETAQLLRIRQRVYIRIPGDDHERLRIAAQRVEDMERELQERLASTPLGEIADLLEKHDQSPTQG